MSMSRAAGRRPCSSNNKRRIGALFVLGAILVTAEWLILTNRNITISKVTLKDSFDRRRKRKDAIEVWTDLYTEGLATDSVIKAEQSIAHKSSQFPRIWFLSESLELRINKHADVFDDYVVKQSLHEQNIFSINDTESVKKLNSKCEPARDWHTKSFPTCNSIHEIDFESGISQRRSGRRRGGGALDFHVDHLSEGLSRAAWLLHQHPQLGAFSQPPIVFKTFLAWIKDYSPKMYEHQRVDALATERLSSSPRVIDIYGFCGESVMNEYGNGGDLHHFFQNATMESIPSVDRLIYARDVALGLVDIHGVDDGIDDNITTMVHHDIKPPNVLLVNDKIKFVDFNNAQLLKWHVKRNTSCGFHFTHTCLGIKNETGWSPQECTSQKPIFTEKMEVVKLGLFFRFLLTGQYPPPESTRELPSIHDDHDKWFWSLLPESIRESQDVAIRAIVDAMDKALTYDTDKRPSARLISKDLVQAAALAIEERMPG